MTTQAALPTKSKPKLSFQFGRKQRLLFGYLLLLPLPFIAGLTLELDFKGWYAATLSLVNLVAMMAFFVQFPLGSRIKQLPLFANIDWSMARHKQVGKWLGVIFLLHPILILAPRFAVSFNDGLISVREAIAAPQLLTGIMAWLLMMVWVLLSIYKDKLPMRYEAWRLTHLIGFIAITVLATLHITSVGRHGQFQQQFNWLWWALCCFSVSMVVYNYLLKPLRLKKQPFTLTEVKRVSSSDWQVTVEQPNESNFHFEAGQFVWLDTSGSAHGVNEHPFSIASCQSELPQMSFIIRELGDYTSSLEQLKPGQPVFIDGPYGSMSLRDSISAAGITLIAGGAGIGPMLSLLRGFAASHDPRPIRLLYGNGRLDQMVLLDEIRTLEQQMADFKLQLVCQEETDDSQIHTGVIDRDCLLASYEHAHSNSWAFYLCGPKGMTDAVKVNLKALKIPSNHVHYEQLSF